MRIVVIGCGVHGRGIAYELSEAGAALLAILIPMQQLHDYRGALANQRNDGVLQLRGGLRGRVG